ncbi:MAG: type III pantothenate kinase [Alistipes sp.]|nr:type III pantothenate kinase [Alistipes sp.]
MKLLIDIGNTRTKWAVWQGDSELEQGVVESFSIDWVETLKRRYSLRYGLVCSTRGDVESVCNLLQKSGLKALVFDADCPVPIKNGYLTPRSLGRDRLAAAVGAATLYPDREVVIIDLGTALTIDHLTADGCFSGGVISPGLEMRFRALHTHTAALPLVEPTDTEGVVGRTTEEAIALGVMNSVAFEIEGYLARFAKKNGDFIPILTGGAAKYFVKRIKNTIFAEPNLVFCGLNRILEYNLADNATTER